MSATSSTYPNLHTDASESPYLFGLHGPVRDELRVTDLKVTHGALPDDLSGMFVRNSGTPQHTPPGRYHWFDGDGMVHGVEIRGGKATYVNRWIHTKAFEIEQAEPEAIWGGLYDPLNMKAPLGPIKDTANTDLVWHNGKLLALWWLSGQPYEIEVPTLETVGAVDFGGTLGKRTLSAHAKVDQHTNELLFFNFNIMKAPYYHYGVVGADGQLSHYEAIETPRPYVPHDIAITPNYTVLLDLALGWDPKALAVGKRRIGFDQSVPARFGVIPRHGGNADVRWFEADPCYIYHTIRAFEDGDDVVMTACRIANPCPTERNTNTARLDHIELVPVLYEWRFNMADGSIKEGPLDDVATEFPRIDDRTWTRNTRYTYNPRIAPRDELLFDGLIRYDLHTGEQVVTDFGPGWYGGEVVFAPRVGSDTDDDGYLVTAMTYEPEMRSEFAVWRADAIEDGPIARVALPRRVPQGFHAEWVPLS